MLKILFLKKQGVSARKIKITSVRTHCYGSELPLKNIMERYFKNLMKVFINLASKYHRQ